VVRVYIVAFGTSHNFEFNLQLYRQQAVEMGFDECHLFMRFLQFDYAVHKPGAGRPPPIHISTVQDDDSAVDR